LTTIQGGFVTPNFTFLPEIVSDKHIAVQQGSREGRLV
jgi:hypothetical protein